jgi:hypothetical protein
MIIENKNFKTEMKKRNARHRGPTESYKYNMDVYERVVDISNAYENIEYTDEILAQRQGVEATKRNNAQRLNKIKDELGEMIKEVN